jgi:GAF domain-containing protein
VTATTGNPGPHIEALELFADVLAQLEDEATPDAFYSQLCEAICRLTSMERAVIFRYDGARRRVRAAGAHGLDVAMFRKVHVTVESAPLARRALQEDRVIEVVTDLDRELSPAYAGQLRDRHLVCTPMVRPPSGSTTICTFATEVLLSIGLLRSTGRGGIMARPPDGIVAPPGLLARPAATLTRSLPKPHR